ncbi:MAG: hypothetical protein ABJ360_24915 [Roseobacter sp.]
MSRNSWLTCSVLFVLNLSAPQVVAQSCPDYFRFVDFGISGADGALQRGGPVFRVVEDGVSLLGGSPVTCLNIPYMFTDGHSLAIPVVTDIGYAPHLVAPNLSELAVKTVYGEARGQAEQNARAHRALLNKAAIQVTRGSDFLCAAQSATTEVTVSCEIINPYDPAFPLVVYCSEQVCRMPVMAIDGTLKIAARWRNLETIDGAAIGPSISEMVTQIHAFTAEKLSR